MKIAGRKEREMCEAKTAIMKKERKFGSRETEAARDAIVLEWMPGTSPENAPRRKPEMIARMSVM